MADRKLIYVADDEINICNIIKSFLVREGFEVETFNDGSSVMEAFGKRQADLLVIDVMMPGLDGFSLCSAIRSQSRIPIIIVSARDTESDKIKGLTLGSDDYLTKPFSPMELVTRIKSILRRIDLDRSGNKPAHALAEAIRIYDITIKPDIRQAEFNGKSLGLTGMEFSLLLYLAENRNRPVSRSELLDKVWGFENEVETRATDDMIKRIRKKLSDRGSILKINTVWGYGFEIAGKASE